MRERSSPGLAACVLGASLVPVDSFGAGFFLTDRGVRPLARAGAFVAGADDGHAVWYNPAGLAVAPNGVLLDASLLLYGNAYTRSALPPGASEPVSFDTVHGSAALLPIPTLVVTHDFGLRHFRFAAGVFAPNAVITSFSDTATAPQRYSAVSIDGSILAQGGLWAAWTPVENFSVGAGVSALFGSFQSKITLSGCPATITCQPEDPEWDAPTNLSVGPIFAPTGNLGVRWQPFPALVFGASGQLPMWIDAPGTLRVRLPSAAFYDGATVQGDRARVQFRFAPIVRAGVEVRPTRHDRIEVAVVWEGWQVHDSIAITPVHDNAQPDGIRITDVRGVGTYDIGPTPIARNFRSTWSVRLGAERDQPIGSQFHLFPRLGVAYEMSATAPESTSVLTLDANKFLLSLGVGFSVGKWRFDLTYAHVFAIPVVVDPRDGQLTQIRPFRANDAAPTYAVNGGRYELNTDVLGVGGQYRF